MSTKRWFRSKTVITAITSIVGTVAAVAAGTLTVAAAAPILVPSILAIFLRDSISKISQ